MIESINNSEKSIILVCHSKDTLLNSCVFAPAEDLLGAPFREYANSIVIKCDTDELVRTIWENVLHAPVA